MLAALFALSVVAAGAGDGAGADEGALAPPVLLVDFPASYPEDALAEGAETSYGSRCSRF